MAWGDRGGAKKQKFGGELVGYSSGTTNQRLKISRDMIMLQVVCSIRAKHQTWQ